MKRVILDDKYELGGGIGAWAKSHENGVLKGEVRVIGGELMFAWVVHFRKYSKNEVWWVPVDKSRSYDNAQLRLWMNGDLS